MGRQMGACNICLSYFAGFLFAAGWFIFIDGAVFSHHSWHQGMKFVFMLPGFCTLVGACMLNLVPWEFIIGDAGEFGRGFPLYVLVITRVFMLISFLVCFVGIIASFWIMLQFFLLDHGRPDWSGIAIFLQSLFIFVSAVVFRFGPLKTPKPDYDDDLAGIV